MKAFIVFIVIRVDIARGLQFVWAFAHLGYPFLVFNHPNRYTPCFTQSRATQLAASICERVPCAHNDGFSSILSGHLRIYNMIQNYIEIETATPQQRDF